MLPPRLQFSALVFSAVCSVSVASGVIAFGCNSCQKGDVGAGSTNPPSVLASAVVSAPASSDAVIPGTPLRLADIRAAVNGGNLAPYDGPTGAIEGTVRISGDPSPSVALNIDKSCQAASATYGVLFREGAGRVLADTLVAVTGYKGFVPVKSDAIQVKISQCAYDARTYSVTFGQRLEIENLDDNNSYVPILNGSKFTAVHVAVPKSNAGAKIKTDPVRLYPDAPGMFDLGDGMNRVWMTADVFSLKFPTHAVSGLDGRYRIEGIPVGDVDVDALLPSAQATAKKKV
ncbi:MAG: hypothetical protein FWD57_05950 [Polyangiaceae bacterium]|nr:hypothetical protein [Polyangiaceae bacterium]